MKTIHIDTPSKSYPVYIGENILDLLKESIMKATKVLIVTDETVNALHIQSLTKSLDSFKEKVEIFVTPAGEHAKSFDVYYECQSFALLKELDRKSLVLAFGGGAVGDLAGFVAATFMRGIPFIQIPTTILAHDSAVGGKVAINHPLGKNLIGSFYQPEMVIYDINFLSTLPEQELRSGFAEVIKHALLSSPDFLNDLMKQVTSMRDLFRINLSAMLEKGIQVKANIVHQDEKENGVRAHLNFGHTLGHAIESLAGYGKWTHGEAVTVGMIYALHLSINTSSLSFDIGAFVDWLRSLGYAVNIPEDMPFLELHALMTRDKKSVAKEPKFVLLKQLGNPFVTSVKLDVLEETYKKLIEK